MIDLSVILPVHNQQDIIKPVCSQVVNLLKTMNISFEVLLIENGSKDNTEKVIRYIAFRNKYVFAFSSSQGYGSAVLKGLEKSCGEHICYMPSDGQVDLSVLPELWRHILSKECDVVKIKRTQRESLLRFLTSWIFSLVISFIFATPIIDINGSPRILKRKKMKDLHLCSTDSFIDAEMLIKATRRRWVIHQIPMKYLPRIGGKSTRTVRTYIEFVYNIYRYKFIYWQ